MLTNVWEGIIMISEWRLPLNRQINSDNDFEQHVGITSEEAFRALYDVLGVIAEVEVVNNSVDGNDNAERLKIVSEQTSFYITLGDGFVKFTDESGEVNIYPDGRINIDNPYWGERKLAKKMTILSVGMVLLRYSVTKLFQNSEVTANMGISTSPTSEITSGVTDVELTYDIDEIRHAAYHSEQGRFAEGESIYDHPELGGGEFYDD